MSLPKIYLWKCHAIYLGINDDEIYRIHMISGVVPEWCSSCQGHRTQDYAAGMRMFKHCQAFPDWVSQGLDA